MKILRAIFNFLKKLFGRHDHTLHSPRKAGDTASVVKTMYGNSPNPFVFRNALQVKSDPLGGFPTNSRYTSLIQHAGYGYYATNIVDDSTQISNYSQNIPETLYTNLGNPALSGLPASANVICATAFQPNVNFGCYFVNASPYGINWNYSGKLVETTEDLSMDRSYVFTLTTLEDLKTTARAIDQVIDNPSTYSPRVESFSDLGALVEQDLADGSGKMSTYLVENCPYLTSTFTLCTPVIGFSATQNDITLGTVKQLDSKTSSVSVTYGGESETLYLFSNQAITWQPQSMSFSFDASSDGQYNGYVVAKGNSDKTTWGNVHKDFSAPSSNTPASALVASQKATTNPLVVRVFRVPKTSETTEQSAITKMAIAQKDCIPISGKVASIKYDTTITYTYDYTRQSLANWPAASTEDPLMVYPSPNYKQVKGQLDSPVKFSTSLRGTLYIGKQTAPLSYSINNYPGTFFLMDGTSDLKVAPTDTVTMDMISAYLTQASNDLNVFNGYPAAMEVNYYDSYAGGKQLYRYASTFLFFAKTLADNPSLLPQFQQVRDSAYQRLLTIIKKWFRENYVYDSTLQSLFVKSNYLDRTLDYQNVQFQDFPIHYGYAIIAASMIAWVEKNVLQSTTSLSQALFFDGSTTTTVTFADAVEALASTVGTNHSDGHLFFIGRTFDHGWGLPRLSGLGQPTADGGDTEGIIEAAHFGLGLYVWNSLIDGNEDQANYAKYWLGRTLLAFERYYAIGDNIYSIYNDPEFSSLTNLQSLPDIAVLFDCKSSYKNLFEGPSDYVSVGLNSFIASPLMLNEAHPKKWKMRVVNDFIVKGGDPSDPSTWASVKALNTPDPDTGHTFPIWNGVLAMTMSQTNPDLAYNYYKYLLQNQTVMDDLLSYSMVLFNVLSYAVKGVAGLPEVPVTAEFNYPAPVITAIGPSQCNNFTTFIERPNGAKEMLAAAPDSPAKQTIQNLIDSVNTVCNSLPKSLNDLNQSIATQIAAIPDDQLQEIHGQSNLYSALVEVCVLANTQLPDFGS